MSVDNRGRVGEGAISLWSRWTLVFCARRWPHLSSYNEHRWTWQGSLHHILWQFLFWACWRARIRRGGTEAAQLSFMTVPKMATVSLSNSQRHCGGSLGRNQYWGLVLLSTVVLSVCSQDLKSACRPKWACPQFFSDYSVKMPTANSWAEET